MILSHPEFIKINPQGSSTGSKYKNEILNDLWICLVSREASLMARREVLTGKAKFGITGDGKEVPQVAMAKVFKKGDFRAGYYRDQTLMLALGLCTVEEYFAQLYADPLNDPFSSGRQMNCHFATPFVDKDENWIDFTKNYNISSDISCTGGQMARATGLAMASKKYRANPNIKNKERFTNKGNEICFCTIGDASTSEGVFWETMNAAAVQGVPLLTSVWDDGYGISVPAELQTVKSSISKAMEGFLIEKDSNGIFIYVVDGWNYEELCKVYKNVANKVRTQHIPALVHVKNLTQPQGHSTSGSHERYKNRDRLDWEREYDCIEELIRWILESKITHEGIIETMREEAKIFVKNAKKRARKKYSTPINILSTELKGMYAELEEKGYAIPEISKLRHKLNHLINPMYSEIVQNARRLNFVLPAKETELKNRLKRKLEDISDAAYTNYSKNLYSHSKKSALQVVPEKPKYSNNSILLNGFQILNKFFDFSLSKHHNLYAFGEDVGQIGDVNQGFKGLQKKYGIDRVFDTGIREWTIIGLAIGMAMRGLRPIAEIQYLDYLVYGLAPLTDDLATLRYRSNGKQMAPAIIRTRGHRLEGIWHAGSPMGMIINALKGMYVCVPRNMVQAVGMYNTLLQSNDPALVIECLNGYRLKERVPDNLFELAIPLGKAEILNHGDDLSLVTYGSCIRIAQKAIELLGDNYSIELIDIQTLIPFDLEKTILQSIKKTNRILFLDEDVPGGATAFMMQQVLEKQGGYQYLDASPVTLTAKNHRPAYGSDGDYFSKPNAEDVYEAIQKIIRE